MYSQMIRRLLILPILLLLVALIAFLFPYLTGIDPTSAILRSRIGEREQTPELVAAINEELGLDEPLPVQFISWVGLLFKGDPGRSFVNHAPVGEILFRGLKVTFILSLVALLFSILVSIPLGVLSALSPGKYL